MKETRLAKQNINIFYKLIKSFLNLLKKPRNEEIKTIEKSKGKSINEFKSNVEVKEDKNKIRLLKLQKDFENGIITENEMDEQDVYELHELYNRQIGELEDSTKNYKQRIIDAKIKLKKQQKQSDINN